MRVSAAQRAPSRSGTTVPKDQDVRTPSRRQAARICHSTERSRAWHRHQWRRKQELHRARVDSLANPSVFPGARARTCACVALVWAHAPVRGRAREAPIAQPLHPSTCRTRAASRRGATPTELGPAAGARACRRARHARERARRQEPLPYTLLYFKHYFTVFTIFT